MENSASENNQFLQYEEKAILDKITKLKYCLVTNFKYEASKNNLFLFSCDNLSY